MTHLVKTISIIFVSSLLLFGCKPSNNNNNNENTTGKGNAIFLHHSTGQGVWDGGVSTEFSKLNSSMGSSFSVSEFSYPNDPYPWDNYPYDYWNLWVNNKCDSGKPGKKCLSQFTAEYELIIFKHCYPGSEIVAESGTPSISSPTKTIGNYKLQYRALRGIMDSYPNNKFMVWTLAPLHRLATNTADAARAREFVNWVKNEWLREDGKAHPNIYIFDFYGLVAESNASPANGKVNCLKYEYELNHNGDDSHPNSTANKVVAPIFAKAIYDALSGK